MSYRMSVDIGGTFTDLVVVDEEGQISVFKSSTTPEDYVAAVISNLRQASESFGIPLEGLMQECSSFVGGSLVHGSTIATNALIEKKVAKTGLICTRGFRDILTDREGGKAEPFNWDQDYPPAYVPRYLTLPVTERINAEGEIETPLLEEEVRQAVRQFEQWGVEVIAVSLIWSIVNPVHELRVGEICREEAPQIPCVLSHQVNPIIREYRRTSSTAINASLLPIVSQYVESFEKRLKEIGYPGGMLMLTSTGGVMSTEELVEKPIYSIDCGPSLAPTAGLWLGQSELGKANVITADMGGTSFDISCVTDGVIAVSRDVWVGDSILGISKVDIKSIGAGGGSIAWVDSGGLLHVGPESAGAAPGPACYGRGRRPAHRHRRQRGARLHRSRFLPGRLDETAPRAGRSGHQQGCGRAPGPGTGAGRLHHLDHHQRGHGLGHRGHHRLAGDRSARVSLRLRGRRGRDSTSSRWSRSWARETS